MKQIVILVFLFFGTKSFSQQLSIQTLGFEKMKLNNCTEVKDQYLSATCWSFAGNSFLESELLKNGKGNFNLSEMFIARHSMKRKIERHLALKGKNFFTPGGQFHDEIWVMKHFGMMPESAYSGKLSATAHHNHGALDTAISHFVKKMLAKGVTQLNATQNKFVDSVLDANLGTIPKTFQYEGKIYTPQSFLQEVLSINPDDYVEITSYTHHPFYKKFVLEDKYNWTGDAYWNVPLADYSAITDQALKNGFTVVWDGDADDPDFQFNKGLAYLRTGLAVSQQDRQKAFEDETTLLDHMMHIVGVTKDKFGNKWYYVKNSWGKYGNQIGGFIFMRNDYFLMRTVAIIVNKNAIPESIRKKMGI